MTATEIRTLLEQYKQGTLNAEGLQLLQRVVEEGHFEEEIREDILDSLRNSAPDAGWQREDMEALLQHILAQETPVYPKIQARSRWRYAAAAVVALGIAGGVTMLVLRRDTPATAVVQVPRNPLAPGSSKAVLILADNSAISLDSSNSGALATQGGAQIVNSNGALTYKGGDDHTPLTYNTVATPHGGQYQLTLADGSRVWLNAASSIRFPAAFKGSERKVEITGEVYFEIAKNAAMPFLVKVKAAGNKAADIAVLGTSFNVMAYQDEQSIRTTLVDGAVKLSTPQAQTLLKPGFQASLTDAGGDFEVSSADIEQTLAWKEGRFRFRNTNIRAIMRQLARWYDIDVVYEGNLSDVDLTGVISRRENADALLKALETTQRVKFDVNGKTVTVKAVAP
ncbi:FecR family protein [Chitinophaga sp. Mgbs1]|uniref:FecR family protein n=1 Tax=Chitinophaga solisilvae TaxID=1233460 RepID=A0A3S1D1V8_9BACT|nr:FecR family protein [Chitinophaga solisilvae]